MVDFVKIHLKNNTHRFHCQVGRNRDIKNLIFKLSIENLTLYDFLRSELEVNKLIFYDHTQKVNQGQNRYEKQYKSSRIFRRDILAIMFFNQKKNNQKDAKPHFNEIEWCIDFVT